MRPADDVLMRRYTRGDDTAFEMLYDRHATPLYDFCRRRVRDDAAAADVLQEVFKRVADARRSYVARGRFRSWIFTIARRVCIDHQRTATRHLRTEDTASHLALDAPTGPDIEEEMAHRDELQRVLAPLRPEQREVLLLSKAYGFTYGEIAGMLETTEAAVRQMVYRTLKALRSQVASSGSST